jgi:hypothetical protein
MLDFLADFVVYGGFLVGVAIAQPSARVACAALLAAYLLNNAALLSFASLIEKRGLPLGDERAYNSGQSAWTATPPFQNAMRPFTRRANGHGRRYPHAAFSARTPSTSTVQ